VICPRPRLLLSRCAIRLAILGLCLSAVLSVRKSAAAADRSAKPYAIIFGTVWGPDDHPLYGVKIKLRREDEKKARWELYSDHNGEFAVHVPAGKQDYVLWADLKGRKSQSGSQLQGDEIRVHVDGDERVDTGLHLR